MSWEPVAGTVGAVWWGRWAQSGQQPKIRGSQTQGSPRPLWQSDPNWSESPILPWRNWGPGKGQGLTQRHNNSWFQFYQVSLSLPPDSSWNFRHDVNISHPYCKNIITTTLKDISPSTLTQHGFLFLKEGVCRSLEHHGSLVSSAQRWVGVLMDIVRLLINIC